MSYHKAVYQWNDVVSSNMPHLSKPQAMVLALWSFGMVLAKSAALSAVSLFLAPILKQHSNTIRQRLREWYWEKKNKRGEKRTQLNVEESFPFLLRWILKISRGKQLAFGLDATLLYDRFAVLAISVLYRGTAIPVIWTILHANQKGAWNPHWRRMIRQLSQEIPADYYVVAFTDRGLYSRFLFNNLKWCDWHPMMRINEGGKFRPQGGEYRPLSSFLPKAGSIWAGKGRAFKQAGTQLDCTLLAFWSEEQEEPWYLLTDLDPESASACCYALRSWIEQGFKYTKREGWMWQRTRMEKPERVARHWLCIAVATLWMVSVGTKEEDKESSFPEQLNFLQNNEQGEGKTTRKRKVSVFRRGLACLLGRLSWGKGIVLGYLRAEPWPRLFTEEQLEKLRKPPLTEGNECYFCGHLGELTD